MKTLLALLALISVAASAAAFAKEKNTKLNADNKSITAPAEETGQKSLNLKQLRGMRPVNTQMHSDRRK